MLDDAKIYGWYDSPHQPKEKPTYNPPLDSLCPHCDKPITMEDMRTHSIMMENAPQCFFYRTHKTCDENSTDKKRIFIDDEIWGLISKDKILELKHGE